MPKISMSVKVRGIEQLQSFFKSLPLKLRGVASKAMAEWFIGDGRRGLRRYPTYKHIKRRDAYRDIYFTAKDGHKVYGFSSLRQLRKVAAIMRDKPAGVPHRTGRYQRGWEMVPPDGGVKVKIVNQVPYAQFVGGDETQARLNKKVGWRTIGDIISTNIKGAIRHAESAIGKLLK